MLPEKLSNGLCSLKPERRPAVHGRATCGSTRAATSTRTQFYPAVMRSHARLTYTQVWQMLGERASRRAAASRRARCCRSWRICTTLYKALLKRARSGAARSTSTPPRCSSVSTSTARSSGSCRAPRNDAHKLIEECMLAANVCAARLPRRSTSIPALYRVHDRPPPDKLADLREFLRGVRLDAAAAATSRRRATTRR